MWLKAVAIFGCLILIQTFLTKYSSVKANYLTVLGPRSIQYEKDYTIELSHSGFGKLPYFNITLEGNEIVEKSYENIALGNQESRTITFKLYNQRKVKDYKLTVTLKDFQQSVKIHTAQKYFVLIQTDKAVYKPGDKVLYRILVLDSATKPYEYSSIKVDITDSANDKVLQKTFFKNEHFDDLVFENSLEINENPIFGDWKISVKIDADLEITEKVFIVREYDLPNFEVFADTPNFVLLSEQRIAVVIYARYNFGEFVKGNVKATVRVSGSVNTESVHVKNFKLKNILTRKTLILDLNDHLMISKMTEDNKVSIEIEFEEEMTGMKRTVTKHVTIQLEDRYFVEVIQPKLQFKPGFPYEFEVVVRKPDGSLEIDSGNVEAKVEYCQSEENCSSNSNKQIKKFVENIKDGKANFELNVPQNTRAFSIRITYQNTEKIVDVLKFPSTSGEYLQAKVTNIEKFDKQVQIEVKTSVVLGKVHCVVTSPTGVSFRKDQSFHTKNFTISFEILDWMYPEAQILIYLTLSSGEQVSDTVELTQKLRNKLIITLDSSSSQPKKTVNIKLQAKPESIVYLLAVDRSVKLQETNEDIDNIFHLNDSQRFDTRDLNFFLAINANESKNLQRSKRSSFGSTENVNKFNNAATPNDEFVSKVRTDFPETWIFKEVMVNSNGTASFEAPLPDTITTWDITGFALSSKFGLGIAKSQEIISTQHFFLKVHLPHSITIGEVLKVYVTVFNYFTGRKNPTSIDVDVTLSEDEYEKPSVKIQDSSDYDEKSEENIESSLNVTTSKFDFFETISISGRCEYRRLDTETSQKSVTKRIKVNQGSGASTFFYIKATEAGNIKLKVRADVVGSIKSVFDEVHRTLRVKHEVITYYESVFHVIDLRQRSSDIFYSSLDFPRNKIKSSIKIETFVTGNLVGSPLKGVEKFLKIPIGGSGFFQFQPIAVAMNYLNATKLLTSEQTRLGQSALKVGVDKIVQARITQGEKKGAFTIWYDNSGSSIWLTAFVTKLFNMAKYWTAINNKNILEALNFLKKQQALSGKFTEYGKVFHSEVQTDLSEGIPLTAFTVIVFLESEDYKDEFKETINKALDYIEETIPKLDDNFVWAITAYALALGGKSVDYLYNILEKKSFYDGRTNTRFWEKSSNTKRGSTSASTKVEIAAYVILAYVKVGKAREAIPVVNWLVTQRNSRGEFPSTHGTVIALQALAAIATELYSDKLDMELKVNYKNNENLVFKLKNENVLLPQRKQLPSLFREIDMEAKGEGIALFQISYSYNKNVMESYKTFNLRVNDVSTSSNVLRLQVCTFYIPDSKSAMAVIEVQLPIGYVADPSFELNQFADMRKFDLKKENSLIVLYFDKIEVKEICPKVQGIRQKIVDNIKPATVTVYDYYNPDRRSTAFYLPSHLQAC